MSATFKQTYLHINTVCNILRYYHRLTFGNVLSENWHVAPDAMATRTTRIIGY